MLRYLRPDRSRGAGFGLWCLVVWGRTLPWIYYLTESAGGAHRVRLQRYLSLAQHACLQGYGGPLKSLFRVPRDRQKLPTFGAGRSTIPYPGAGLRIQHLQDQREGPTTQGRTCRYVAGAWGDGV